MANGLQGLFGGSALSGGLALYESIFPVLFGNGAAGAVTLGTIADGGYLGTFGAPQYTSLTLPPGNSITLPPGSGNGALMVACQGTFTLGGSIVANGGVGGNGTVGVGGGAGGGTAGGGAGGAATSGTLGNPGLSPAKIGHGCLPNTSRGASGGASSSGTATGLISLVADSGFGPSRLIDPVTGLRFSPPTSTAIYASVTNISTAFGTPSRSLSMPMFTPASPAFSMDLLPTGLAGLPGTNIGQTNVFCPGGGGGGGVVYIEAGTIVFQAGHSIQANGGNGGNGATAGGSTTVAGASGGDGGLVILIANQFIGTPNVSVNGGAAGSGVTGGGATPVAPTPLPSLAGHFLMIQV